MPGHETTGRRLVLVTGVGRSGTSLMAGSLHHLGVHVPGPYLGANRSNPRGFYESRWSVRFHNRLLAEAGVATFDARPEAYAAVQRAVTPRRRERLHAFLDDACSQVEQVAVKDPRTVWTQRLWAEQSRRLGVDVGFVTMLRHPLEVAASRSTYYAADAEPARVRAYRVLSVARWVNHTLLTERHTRGGTRAFARYTDVLDDWRSVVPAVAEATGLRVDHRPEAARAVDDFVDPGLRRHDETLADASVPTALRELAHEVWLAVQTLVTDPADAAAGSRLDALSSQYAALVADAAAVTEDWLADARRTAAHEKAQTVTPPPHEVPASAEDRLVRDVRAAELARVLAARVTRRLRPR